MTIRYMIATIPHVWKDMKELATTFFAVLTSSGLKCCQGKTESHHIVQYARTIIGTPRITSTKIEDMILQALFLSTLNKPKNIPRIQAKNRPHKARSRVCPIARSSRFPYLVMIWIMENSFQKQSCHKMQQPCNSCSVLSQSEFSD